MNENVKSELNELAALVERLQCKELNRIEFRGHSVNYGVYTQRQPDRYFVRIRVPHGVISPAQLTRLAEGVETYGPSECHLTIRQGFEVHDLLLDQIMPLLRTLAEVELLSHETGGNSIRSIMVCPHAGVGADEPFDVTSYAEMLTRHFVRHPDFQTLPRKMKIAFSCCEQDCVRSFAQDLGFQACKSPAGECGFRVLVGGGTGALPRLGQEFLEFLPAEQVCSFTEAFLRVFNRLGDRQNRRRARVKFLVQSLGVQKLFEETMCEWAALQSEMKSYPPLQLVSDSPSKSTPDTATFELLEQTKSQLDDDKEFSQWATIQTQPQRQAGFRTVRVSLAGGSITAGQLRQLAALVERFELTIRLTPEQGFLLRWARANQLFQIYQLVSAARLCNQLVVSRLIACPGSQRCSNAFTNTSPLAQAVAAQLATLSDSSETVCQLHIRLCGCSNGCGLHALADIGLEGMASRTQNEWFPVYHLWVGGRESQNRPKFGKDLGTLPARRVPACVTEMVGYYLANRKQYESLAGLLERVGAEPFVTLVKKHQPESIQDWRELAMDWGESKQYQPRSAREAGVC